MTFSGISPQENLLLTVRPIVCLGDMLMSNFPVPFAEKVKLCRKLIGIATVLCDPIRYDMSLKLPSGGINERMRSDYKKLILYDHAIQKSNV